MANDPISAEVLPKGLYTFHPGLVAEARGCRLLCKDGREFLDLTSGLGVLALGHGDSRLMDAMARQMEQLVHQCAHVMLHGPYVELARLLCQMAPLNGQAKAFLCNSGAEAVEWAVKVARCATGRSAIVAFDGGYHGRTLLAATLTSRAKPYRKGYGSLAPDIHHVPYPYCYRCQWSKSRVACSMECLGAIERFFLLERAPEEVAAILVEPVQGEGGVVIPPHGFLGALAGLCEKHGILLVADEVQTGLGRTGRTFALEHEGIRPDIMVLGKALGGGLPLAAVLGRAELMDSVPPSGFGSTFGGNPLACASGIRLMELLRDGGPQARATQIQETFTQRGSSWMERIHCVGEVRARGAMLGLELVREPEGREPAPALAREVVRRCRENGVLILSGGLHRNVIRLLPPLVISQEELEKGLEVLEQVLREVAQPCVA